MSGIATPGFRITHSPDELWGGTCSVRFAERVPSLLLFDLEPVVEGYRGLRVTGLVLTNMELDVEHQLKVWAYRGELYQEMTATGYRWRYRLRGRPFPRNWVNDILDEASRRYDEMPSWMKRREIGR